MPIRTNRGRAAVYRRLWGWPLRSPRHLVVTLVVLAVLAIAVAVVTTQASARHNAGGTAVGDSATPTIQIGSTGAAGTPGGTTGSAAPTTRLLSPPETPQSAPPSPQAVSVIEAWGQAWVRHPVGMTNQQWLAQLQPYTTPECLQDELSTVNVANVNATQVTGSVSPTKSFTSSVEALLPTNAGTLDITAINTPQGWLVSSYTEAS